MTDADDMSAYREVFESESREFLQLLSDALLKLESSPGDLGPVDEVFRAAHSLKGMAAAMGYDAIAGVAHKLESLVDTVRKRERAVTSELVDLLLVACDGLGEAIAAATTGNSDDELLSSLEAQLVAAFEAPASAPEAPSGIRWTVKVVLEESCALRSVRAYMVLKRLSQLGDVVDTKPSMQEIEDESFEREFEATLQTPAEPDAIADAVREINEVEDVRVESGHPGEERRAEKRAPRLSDSQTVRVSVGHIDEMVNLVGELVIARSRIQQMVSNYEDADLKRALEELGSISVALQQVVLTTRMVPVAQIFNRFPRMVRDLAQELDRPVDFTMDGLDIELDRTVLDEIGDPLVHLLRNAIGHGVESAADREAAGKSATATVKLSAMREKTSVSIVVEDDGKGIDVESIRAKAVERDIWPAETAASMSKEECYGLICTPNFSTAKQTTELFGRGVGLDAVKEKIEQLGGSMTIQSELGVGSRFILALPLTLAIVQALLLEDCGYVFAIPMANITEAHAVSDVPIKTIDGSPVALLAERVVPLRSLQEAMGRERPPQDGTQMIIVAWREDETGLIVERLLGKQEVVIKPLPEWLRGVKGVAGATVLGDGRVALIVDVRSLIAREGRT
jgi:two-component system chemotaxis sensor kinase CheA